MTADENCRQFNKGKIMYMFFLFILAIFAWNWADRLEEKNREIDGF